MGFLNKIFTEQKPVVQSSNYDFPVDDLKVLKKNLQLEEEALKKTISQNFNFENDHKIDEIKNLMKTKIDEKNHEYHRNNTSDSKRFHDMEMKLGVDEIDMIKDNFEHDLDEKLTHFKNEISDKKKQIFEIENSIKLFKLENNINRPAIYPSKRSKCFTWIFIALLMLFEIWFSGSFFAKGNELGLMGGIAFASVITLVMVLGGAFLINLLYKFTFVKKHKNNSKKYCLTTLFLGLMIILIILNILIAHHREEVANLNPTAFTFGKIFEPINEFDSILLIVFNLTCLVICSYKLYHLSEPFPDYESLDRKHKKILQEFNDLKDDNLDYFNSQKKEVIEEIEKKYQQIAGKSSELQNMYNREKKWLKSYPEYIKTLENQANLLIKFYAEMLEKNGNKISAEQPKITLEKHELETIGIDFEKYIERFKKEFTDAKEPYINSIKKINEIYKKNFNEYQNLIQL